MSEKFEVLDDLPRDPKFRAWAHRQDQYAREAGRAYENHEDQVQRYIREVLGIRTKQRRRTRKSGSSLSIGSFGIVEPDGSIRVVRTGMTTSKVLHRSDIVFDPAYRAWCASQDMAARETGRPLRTRSEMYQEYVAKLRSQGVTIC